MFFGRNADFFVCDLSVCFSFDPFSEVVFEDQDEASLAGTRKRSYDIHRPSHERVMGGGCAQHLGWAMDAGGVSLALVAASRV
ncbi:hypothetical protein Bca4012_041618 [Brassica carinata]